MQGNPLAKLGVLLLFFGLAYLMKYTVERDMLPIEFRLMGAAVASGVLLWFGWRLRVKQTMYALILQGARLARSISPYLVPSGFISCCHICWHLA